MNEYSDVLSHYIYFKKYLSTEERVFLYVGTASTGVYIFDLSINIDYLIILLLLVY